MAVTIEPTHQSVQLRVSGDIETRLTIPFDDDDRFMLGISDGTLLVGTFDGDLCCSWRIVRAGAGFIRIADDRVSVDGDVEWVTASLFEPKLIEPRQPQSLPLFPNLDRRAA